MKAWNKSAAGFAALIVFTLMLFAGEGLAEEGPPPAAAQAQKNVLQPPETKEPQQVPRVTPYNARRVRLGVEVTANLQVNPIVYKGPCPAVFTLKGYISANRPTAVQYKFVRKDGPPMKPVTLVFDKAGAKEVSETFTVGAAGASSASDGWAHLEAVFPVNMKVRSDTVFYSGTCTTAPGIGSQAEPGTGVKEYCVSFDTARTRLYEERNVWKIADGAQVLFTFVLDKIEAENALAIIKQYGMNKSCFLGQPKASFHYMLSGDSAPSGPFKGESCKAIKPEAMMVQQTKAGWIIQADGKPLIAFAERKTEADQALAIIKKYGFTQFCLMATGKVDYLYMRK